MEIDINEEVRILRGQLSGVRADVDGLKKHRTECDTRHEQHEVYGRRRDDAAAKQTETMMLLVQTTIKLDATMRASIAVFEKTLEAFEKEIKPVRDFNIAFRVNKGLFQGAVMIAAGIVTLVTAYHFFITPVL